MNYRMTAWDLFITPIYILLIYSLAQYIRNGIKDKNIRGYFLPALRVKMIGAIALGVIYQFYYDGGDTYNFYRDATIMWGAFKESISAWAEILVLPAGELTPSTQKHTQYMYFFIIKDNSTFNVVRAMGFFSPFTFNTYSSIAILFAFTSFSGMWAMFRAFYHMYPGLHKPLAYASFFIPSVFFWGSGAVKDTLSIGALGWIFYTFYFGIILRRKIIFNLIGLVLASLVLYNIKSYILLAFAGGLMMWLFMHYRLQIKWAFLRILLIPVMLAGGGVTGYLAIASLAADQDKYQLENIGETARVNSEWLEHVSREQKGSTYSLGITDWSPMGLLVKSPQALWLALFQPHPWQAKNPIMMLSALESLFILILTIQLFMQVNIFTILRLTLDHPVLYLCLVFTFILGLAVAINSGNYGTMVRYRIPYQPFYLAMVYILRYITKANAKLY